MSKKKVLVVDDEEMIRDIFKSALSRSGHTVLLAESAEEAMDILRTESIMVIFLDLNLPEMNGVDLCKKIHMDNPVAIISAITGYSDLFSLMECRKAGFDDFFCKPISLDTIMKSAEDAFEKLERWEIEKHDLM
jgi:DNA-binding NtrC family response regulator